MHLRPQPPAGNRGRFLAALSSVRKAESTLARVLSSIDNAAPVFAQTGATTRAAWRACMICIEGIVSDDLGFSQWIISVSIARPADSQARS